MTSDYKVVIVGAGVVGLAVARALAQCGETSVLIIEKDGSFGRGTSSRNSEVIHSGIYYEDGSEKARFCVKANERLYEFCAKENVWHNRCGKLIVAQKGQEESLTKLLNQGQQNGVKNILTLTRKEITKLEPDISAELALLVESTGIISAHELMAAFYRISQSADHDILYHTAVRGVNRTSDYYSLEIEGQNSAAEIVNAEWIVNAAGLYSAVIAGFVMDDRAPGLRFSKGEYFNMSSRWRNRFNHLIYPLPDEKNDSLGIHLSFDQSGSSKLGPSATWLNPFVEDYNVDGRLKKIFFKEARKYLPELEKDHIAPDFSGIRPKYFLADQDHADFYISHETEAGLEGWINLVGIDSPGLTAAISIGETTAEWILKEKRK